jgi:TetR/AcrR family tetracycline transcriptional repressor
LQRAKGPTLTPERIVAAALQELDERGLAAFSIRSVAQRLGVYPTAIYWHVANRDALLAEIVARILASVEPRRDLAWQRYLRALFASYRTAIKRHPGAAPLVGAHLVGNRSIRLSLVDGVLAKLVEAGFRGERLVAAYNTVIAALVGFVTQEFAAVPDEARAAWRSAVRKRLARAELEAYPVLRDHLPLLANRAFILRWHSGAQAPMDRSFDCYVDVVVGGLERLAARRPRRRRP